MKRAVEQTVAKKTQFKNSLKAKSTQSMRPLGDER